MLFGAAYGAQRNVPAVAGRQDYIEGSHFSHFFEEFSRGGTKPRTIHPCLKGTPHHERQEADENMRLGSFRLLMEDRP